MENTKQELENLWQDVMGDETEDPREIENEYLDTLTGDEDIDDVINGYMFFWL